MKKIIGVFILVCIIVTAFVLSVITFIHERHTNKYHVKKRILLPRKITSSSNNDKENALVTQTFTYTYIDYDKKENRKLVISHDDSLRFIYDRIATNKNVKCLYVNGSEFFNKTSHLYIGIGDNGKSSPILLTTELDHIDITLNINIFPSYFHLYMRQSSDDHTASDLVTSDGSRWKKSNGFQIHVFIIEKTMRLTLSENGNKKVFQPDTLLYTDSFGIADIYDA
jgi:hypothetical protein